MMRKVAGMLGSPGSRDLLATGLLLVSALYAIAVGRDPALANHDVGWTIYAGGELLRGAEFGADLIDNNPPLIYWGGAVVSGLAGEFGIPVVPLYLLSVVALVALCSLGVRHLLAAVIDSPAGRDAVALALFSALLIVPGYELGQRDQMIAALLMPFLAAGGLAAAERPVATGARVAIGLGAGLALSLKPHFLLTWLAVELVVASHRRSLLAWSRLENWVMALVGAAYVGAVAGFAPEYLGTIRETLAVYHAYDNPVALLSPRTAIGGLALVVLLLVRPRGPVARCATVAACAVIAGFLVVLVQRKGFDYHYVPMLVASLFLVALLVEWLAGSERTGSAPDSRQESGRKGVYFGAVVLLSLAALAATWATRLRYEERTDLVTAIREYAEGGSVLYFSSSVDPLFPSLLFTDSRSVSPYSCLWLVAGNYTILERQARPFPYRSLEEMSELERDFVVRIVDAMEREAPAVLFFDRNVGKQAFGITAFEFERYFLAEPRFARLLESYRVVGMVGTALAYRRVDDRF